MKEEENRGGYVSDDRHWKPEKPNSGKNVYKVRFLPIISDYQNPIISIRQHMFRSPITGKWVFENCPTTINQPCPLCNHAGKLYNTGVEADEKRASLIYRKQQYLCNILVVKDTPQERADENDGKVFIWKFGKKIHEKIQSALFPETDEEGINIFDAEAGFDFNVIVTKQDNFPNYDTSDFSRVATPLGKSKKAMTEVLESVYDLKVYLTPESFKTYAELNEILNTLVLGRPDGSSESSKDVSSETTSEVGPVPYDDVPDLSSKETVKDEVADTGSDTVTEETESSEDDDDAFLDELSAELDGLED